MALGDRSGTINYPRASDITHAVAPIGPGPTGTLSKSVPSSRPSSAVLNPWQAGVNRYNAMTPQQRQAYYVKQNAAQAALANRPVKTFLEVLPDQVPGDQPPPVDPNQPFTDPSGTYSYLRVSMGGMTWWYKVPIDPSTGNVMHDASSAAARLPSGSDPYKAAEQQNLPPNSTIDPVTGVTVYPPGTTFDSQGNPIYRGKLYSQPSGQGPTQVKVDKNAPAPVSGFPPGTTFDPNGNPVYPAGTTFDHNGNPVLSGQAYQIPQQTSQNLYAYPPGTTFDQRGLPHYPPGTTFDAQGNPIFGGKTYYPNQAPGMNQYGNAYPPGTTFDQYGNPQYPQGTTFDQWGNPTYMGQTYYPNQQNQQGYYPGGGGPSDGGGGYYPGGYDMRQEQANSIMDESLMDDGLDDGMGAFMDPFAAAPSPDYAAMLANPQAAYEYAAQMQALQAQHVDANQAEVLEDDEGLYASMADPYGAVNPYLPNQQVLTPQISGGGLFWDEDDNEEVDYG